jgi:hypothetical protein
VIVQQTAVIVQQTVVIVQQTAVIVQQTAVIQTSASAVQIHAFAFQKSGPVFIGQKCVGMWFSVVGNLQYFSPFPVLCHITSYF